MARHNDGISLRRNSWWLDFTHRGRRHTKRLGKGISRSVARELGAVERAAILKGEAGIGGKKPKDLSFEAAAEAFLQWVRTNKRPNTVRDYAVCLAQLAKSFPGTALSQITPFLVEKHKHERAKAGARVRANREVAVLKSLYNRCIGFNLYEGVNPVNTHVHFLEEPKRRLRFLDPEEAGRLVSAAQEPLRTMILVGVCQGFRMQAELLTLRWANVDFTRNLLTVEAAYAKNGLTRAVRMHSMVREALLRIQARAPEGAEYVFARPDGTPYHSIRTAFTTACKKAKLSDVTPHTLRHSFASQLVMGGADLRTIQEFGGWQQVKMVERYSHLSASHKAKAIELIKIEFPQNSHIAFPNANTIPIAPMLESVG